jgi:3-deoxy-D-manno-octulosonic-acid transferase
MRYLLDIVYLTLIIAVSPWLIFKSITTGKYRQGFAEKFFGRVPRSGDDRPRLWIHAVSVGEVNLLGHLIDELRGARADLEIVLSTTTRTGMELARKKYPELPLFYCPLDFSWSTSAALKRIRPSRLVLAELELWPNLIDAACRAGVPVTVINGRLSENSFRGYRRIRPFVAPVVAKIDRILAQDETYAERFVALGAKSENVFVTGSMKYDGANTDRNDPRAVELRTLVGLTDTDRVFLAGSTQEPEEQAALDTFAALADKWPDLRLIIVPRHPERFASVARILDASGHSWRRRSDLEEQGPLSDQTRILLVDTIGELGSWWASAQLAFVGGSFGNRGGQNMLEPAAYGAAVSFGPNTRNFRDIVAALLQADAAQVVDDPADLTRFVRRALEEPQFADRLGRNARELVQSQLGATARTIELLID